YRRELVERRQRRVRVQRDEAHAEVVGQKSVRERAEGHRAEDELPRRHGARERHPVPVADGRAGERQHGLQEREAEREDQREMSELRNHGWLAARTFSSASATSGGM